MDGQTELCINDKRLISSFMDGVPGRSANLVTRGDAIWTEDDDKDEKGNILVIKRINYKNVVIYLVHPPSDFGIPAGVESHFLINYRKQISQYLFSNEISTTKVALLESIKPIKVAIVKTPFCMPVLCPYYSKSVLGVLLGSDGVSFKSVFKRNQTLKRMSNIIWFSFLLYKCAKIDFNDILLYTLKKNKDVLQKIEELIKYNLDKDDFAELKVKIMSCKFLV